ADRNPLVVRQEWVVRTKHAPEVRGVLDGGVEVGVVLDDGRRGESGLACRKGDAALHRLVARDRARGAQCVAQETTKSADRISIERHQPVERAGAATLGGARLERVEETGVTQRPK